MGRRIVVTSHAHWDREWYRAAGAFRVRLLPLVAEVLERDGPFLLDGQGIVLDDYLAWRPADRERLARRLASGDLEAGPWYVLADNALPSGEALVRNLLAGRDALDRAGGPGLPVLYCPDTFGHPAAGPVLAAGFGLPLAIVWRGYGGRSWPAGDAARWRAPSGDEVQLYHLPRDGYEHGAALPTDREGARTRWAALLADLAPRAGNRTLLVLNGADHHALQRGADEALACAREVATGAEVVASPLGAFARARRDETAAIALPVVAGELRASPDYTWTLGGTGGSRASQKRENARLERRLVRQVEPWTALAWWDHGTDLADAERAAWRLALENHPHDTLCGCSIDAVAAEMDARLRRVGDIAHELLRQATIARSGLDPDATRDAFSQPGRAIVVANAAARPRSGVVELELDVPLAPVGVGPGSAAAVAEPRERPPIAIGDPPVPVQRLTSDRVIALHESARHYPRAALVQRERHLAWVEDVPALGMRVFPVQERRALPRLRQPVIVRGSVVSNGHLTLRVDGGGMLAIESEWGTLEGVLALESEGERGDLYTHSPIPGTRQAGRPRAWRVTARGPLRAELSTEFEVPVAARELTSATGRRITHPAAHARVRARVQLDAGAPWCRMMLSGDHALHDVRLRAVVRTGVAGDTYWADAAFGDVRRDRRPPASAPGDVEVLPATGPMHRYVTCDGPGAGVTVFSDGLGEVEVRDGGDVAVTLLRAVGELSRADLPERPGHAGWPAEVPAAQCPGPWEAMLAVFPHGPRTDARRANVADVADDVLLPLRGTTSVPLGVSTIGGLALEGEGLAFLACKRSADGAALVVRCLNTSTRAVAGSWHLPGLASASLSRLDETGLAHLPVREDRVRFVVPPHAVSTILLRRD